MPGKPRSPLSQHAPLVLLGENDGTGSPPRWEGEQWLIGMVRPPEGGVSHAVSQEREGPFGAKTRLQNS